MHHTVILCHVATKRWLANSDISCWASKRRRRRTASCCGTSPTPWSHRRRSTDSDWRSGPSDRRPGRPSHARRVFYKARRLAAAAAAAVSPSLCPWWERTCRETGNCICTQHTTVTGPHSRSHRPNSATLLTIGVDLLWLEGHSRSWGWKSSPRGGPGTEALDGGLGDIVFRKLKLLICQHWSKMCILVI